MSTFHPMTEKIFYIAGQRYSDTKLSPVMLKRRRPLDFTLRFSEQMQGCLLYTEGPNRKNCDDCIQCGGSHLMLLCSVRSSSASSYNICDLNQVFIFCYSLLCYRQ